MTAALRPNLPPPGTTPLLANTPPAGSLLTAKAEDLLRSPFAAPRDAFGLGPAQRTTPALTHTPVAPIGDPTLTPLVARHRTEANLAGPRVRPGASTSAETARIQRDLARTIALRTAGVATGTVAAGGAAALLFPGQPDKMKHAAGCAAISGTVSAVTGRPLVGFAAGAGVGVAKELVDGSRLNPNGHRDFRLNGDLGADLLGAALGAATVGITIKL